MAGGKVFWDFIESRMCCIVPRYLINLLAMQGYENAFSIRRLTMEDIGDLNKYAKSAEMKNRSEKNSQIDYRLVLEQKQAQIKQRPASES